MAKKNTERCSGIIVNIIINTEINNAAINRAIDILVDNRMDEDEAFSTLQAIGYALLNVELFPEEC